MLDTDTKRRIDTARDILVGKVPDPKSQVEQITIALIYKFMDDIDAESEELGGHRKFFAGEYARYGWAKLMRSGLGGHEMRDLYRESLAKMPENPGIPLLFREILKDADLPYRDPETLRAFLKIIDDFSYDHSERLGDAFEYLLSVLGSQGDAGQFRTPRHIIDFIVEVVDPRKTDVILDPACGTAGFLISAYKHILRNNSSKPSPPAPLPSFAPSPPPLPKGEEQGEGRQYRGGYTFAGLKDRARELRNKQTDAEALLWELLRDRQLGNAKFRRQHQFGDYICDFYCHEAKLVVECDGDVHQTAERRQVDAKRDTYLKSQGLTVLRFPNDQVLRDTDSVLKAIAQQLSPPSPSSSPYGRGGGEGEIACLPGDLLTPDERGRLAANFKGYDISPDMVRLSLVNLYLHGFTDPHIHEYDTLTYQDRWNEYADVILANPPFMSPKGGIKPHNRFSVQSKRSEVLFVDYMAEHLTPNGRAGIIVPEGIIFQSQTAYTQLRKLLVEEYLVAVVSLPAGVFNPYSGVKTSILILDKTLARQSQTIGFFKVENDGYGLGAQRRPIDKNDLPEIAAMVKDFRLRIADCGLKANHQSPIENQKCLVVPKEKIAANGDYNLSGERYREGTVRASFFPNIPLGEVCDLIGGATPSKQDASYWTNGTVKWISSKHIDERGLITAYELISKKAVEETSTRVAPKDSTIIITRVSVGKFAFANDDYAINQDLTALVSKDKERLAPEFIRVAAHHIAQIVERNAEGIGVRGVTRSFLSGLQIPLPPLEIQKEIVAEIEGYQKVIDGARAVLDNYRPHIPIRPEWPMVKLGEVCEINPETLNPEATYAGQSIFYIDISSVENGTGRFMGYTEVASAEAPSRARRVVRPGDVLLSTVRPNLKAFTLLKEVRERAVASTGFAVLRSRTELLEPMFLLTCVFADSAVDQMVGMMGRGAYPSINQSEVASIRIPLPPLETQRAIVAEIEAEQALVAANRDLIARMEKKIHATLARVWGEEKG